MIVNDDNQNHRKYHSTEEERDAALTVEEDCKEQKKSTRHNIRDKSIRMVSDFISITKQSALLNSCSKENLRTERKECISSKIIWPAPNSMQR